MRTVLTGILVFASTLAYAQTIEEMVRERSPAEIVTLWQTYEYKCRTDISGQVTADCLARTELADILRKRGYCQNVIGNTWSRCIVGD